jgi:hypothetical protein
VKEGITGHRKTATSNGISAICKSSTLQEQEQHKYIISVSESASYIAVSADDWQENPEA